MSSTQEKLEEILGYFALEQKRLQPNISTEQASEKIMQLIDSATREARIDELNYLVSHCDSTGDDFTNRVSEYFIQDRIAQLQEQSGGSDG